MTKDTVMQRVRALASERGGHVSLRVFVSETGINDRWLRGREWWTDGIACSLKLESRHASSLSRVRRWRALYRPLPG
jgi:hypothetical protein